MDNSKSEAQAASLIDLVLKGGDPTELMTNAIDEIKESTMSASTSGISMRVNTSVTAEKVGGGTVSISKGDTVSVVQPHLGEHGYDSMVLLGDGVTRAIVSGKILGESDEVEEEDDETSDDDLDEGSNGGASQPPAKGKVFSFLSKFQGQSAPPKVDGSKKPTKKETQPGAVQGKPLPKSPAQPASSMMPISISGKKLESEITQAIEMMIEGEENTEDPSIARLQTILPLVKDLDEAGLEEFHALLFADEPSLDDLETVIEKCKSDKKKKIPPQFLSKKNDKDDKKDESEKFDILGSLLEHTEGN